MPKSIAMNDQPRRRKAAAAQKERGLVMQIMLHSPKDTLAGAIALATVLAITVNAVFLQAGRHPSPLFGTMVPVAENLSPPPVAQKVEVVPAAPAQQAPSAAPQTAGSPLPRPRPVEAEARPSDPLGNLVRSTSMQSALAASNLRPPGAIPAAIAPGKGEPPANLSSQRVAAVQRALTDYGYGQIKATGTVGADTQAAIQKFERERKLPVTGQISERLVRELSLATGRSFE
ncbi:peptidoglycan-binding domain-containing protein [Bradyrhizobium sp. LHD-71]|uniref:peptidoglycan-binding domain-containing protein n=1 Tax=Bradyrhizobium sp. LHD-71 TaxID=3072141 RepID=UPI00280EDC70|nr:peptidoglycan-binding domain-containing protein [Bradyrhizobium sp. LHD-71]MDQ8728561.1 peptidoglycan-binding domain-containing protein [Bradyrhizobium sp. LHD-71]